VDPARGYPNVRAADSNPPENRIPSGINEDALLSAIEGSGYPLQVRVAAELKDAYSVMEEWGYRDPDTDTHRTLDIRAFRWVGDVTAKHGSVNPGLLLLIECKRSKLPYVFFKSAVRDRAPGFPQVLGLRKVRITSPERASTQVEPEQILGLYGDVPGVALPPVIAALSRAIPKGKHVSLSGKEPFNSLVLPLVKAVRHEITAQRVPRKGAESLYPNLVIPLAVIDAPMLLVETPPTARDPVLVPWVRLVRHERIKETSGLFNSAFYALEAVHASYFHAYVEQYLNPIAQLFSERVHRQAKILRDDGEAPQLFGWSWDQVRPAP
jgi:hypothetical protein